MHFFEWYTKWVEELGFSVNISHREYRKISCSIENLIRIVYNIMDVMQMTRKSKTEIRNPKTEIRTRKPKLESRKPKFEIRNPKFETQNSKPEIRNPKTETRNPKTETRNPKTEIRNPKTKIRYLKTEVRNSKTLCSFSPGSQKCQMHPTILFKYWRSVGNIK